MLCLISSVQLHKQADMQEEKNRIERVLGAIASPDLIQRVLTFSLSVCWGTYYNTDLHRFTRIYQYTHTIVKNLSTFFILYIQFNRETNFV